MQLLKGKGVDSNAHAQTYVPYMKVLSSNSFTPTGSDSQEDISLVKLATGRGSRHHKVFLKYSA